MSMRRGGRNRAREKTWPGQEVRDAKRKYQRHNDGLTSRERSKKWKAEGKCPRCGTPCAPYSECETHLAYQRERETRQRRERGASPKGAAAFSDKRFWPRPGRKPVGLDVSLVERPTDDLLLSQVDAVIPPKADADVKAEMRQRLVIGVLEGQIPAECLRDASIKCRREIELREIDRGFVSVEVIDNLRVQHDFAHELIEAIDKYEQLTNIPFVRWREELDVMEEYTPLPPKPKPYHHPIPKRGMGTQNGSRRLKTAWRYSD